jgi:prefoldin subunit 5
MTKREAYQKKMKIRLIYVRGYVSAVLVGCLLAYLYHAGVSEGRPNLKPSAMPQCHPPTNMMCTVQNSVSDGTGQGVFSYMLLIRAGDVELNPGPQDKGSIGAKPATRQAKLSIASGSTTEELSLADVMSKLNVMDNATQDRLNAIDVSMSNKLDEVMQEVCSVKNRMTELQDEVEVLRGQVSELQAENDDLKTDNIGLLNRVSSMESTVDDLEGRSRRNNLIFHGLDKEEGETNESCEQRIKEFCTDKLEICEDLEFDRVHRLGSKAKAPLIARCTFFKQKVSILKAKGKLKGSNYFVGEDFSKGVREIRKKLSKYMKEMKEAGRTVSMIYDHLVVDGKKYYLSGDGESVKEGKQ